MRVYVAFSAKSGDREGQLIGAFASVEEAVQNCTEPCDGIFEIEIGKRVESQPEPFFPLCALEPRPAWAKDVKPTS
jgi:hypothetical protein